MDITKFTKTLFEIFDSILRKLFRQIIKKALADDIKFINSHKGRRDKKTATNYVGSIRTAEFLSLASARRMTHSSLDSTFIRKRKGRKTSTSIAKERRQLVTDIRGYYRSIRSLYAGLEKLKLGKIRVEYLISGSIKRSGAIGKLGIPEKENELVVFNIFSKYSRLTGIAYSYRGYRFKTDKDMTQGKGIAGVVSIAGLS